MSFSQTISTSDSHNTQQAYMAQFYNFLESFIGLPLHNPHAPSLTPNELSFPPKATPEGLRKRAFKCCLCGAVYPTPVHLAQHSCPQMTRTAFQCRDCHKAFSCSANLASHQRWHRPRSGVTRRIQHTLHPHRQFGLPGKLNSLAHTGERSEKTKGTFQYQPTTNIDTITAPYQVCHTTSADTSRAPSFSIDSILYSGKNKHQSQDLFACFLCAEKFFTQTNFEDHIIDHLLSTRE
ncbi:Insulinoma-associated protein 1 [Echinococcus granulosus]|nr:Insulinoma-associated protein 1 [Echinococcus granulosus]